MTPDAAVKKVILLLEGGVTVAAALVIGEDDDDGRGFCGGDRFVGRMCGNTEEEEDAAKDSLAESVVVMLIHVARSELRHLLSLF